jgi:hypothetical protein
MPVDLGKSEIEDFRLLLVWPLVKRAGSPSQQTILRENYGRIHRAHARSHAAA